MSSTPPIPELNEYTLIESSDEEPQSQFFIWQKGDNIIAQKKILISELEDPARIINNFQKIKTSKHENIVNYIAIFEDKSEKSLSMFYQFEKTLGLARFFEVQLEPIIIFDIFYQLLNAIQFLHNNGIMHTNIKPSNILLSPTGVPKLVDIGARRKLRESDNITPAEISNEYSSPEFKQTKVSTFSDDIYSLCLVLYEFCTSNKTMVDGKFRPSRHLIYPSSFVKLLLSVLNEKPENRPTLSNLIQNVNYFRYPPADTVETKRISNKTSKLTPELFLAQKTRILPKILKASKKGALIPNTFLINYSLSENWVNDYSHIQLFFNSLCQVANFHNPSLIDLLGLYYFVFLCLNANRNDVYQTIQLLSMSYKQLHLPHTRYLLSLCYLKVAGVYLKLGIETLKEMAEHKYAPAMNQLGLCYLQGIGVEKDPLIAFQWFFEASTRQYIDSYYNIAHCYLNGAGVDKDFQKAIEYYKIAIKYYHQTSIRFLTDFYQNCTDETLIDKQLQNDLLRIEKTARTSPEIDDIYSLGYYYLKGCKGFKANGGQAALFFKMISDLHKGACLQSAIIILKGKYAMKNIESARGHFEHLVNNGIIEAHYYLGLVAYTRGPNFVEAISHFQIATETGSDDAIFQLVLCNILLNLKNEARLTKNISLLRKAISNKHVQSIYANALFHQNAFCVQQNPQYAFDCFKWLTQVHCTMAYHDLGLCYLKGEGTEKNISLAIQAFVKGAEAKNVGCMAELANCYLKGIGTDKNEEKAFDLLLQIALKCEQLKPSKITENKDLDDLYQQAIYEPYLESVYTLGIFYKNGIVTKKNNNEAFRWFKLAANKNHYVSKYELGLFYEYGIIVEIDMKKAVSLYEIAATKAQYFPAINHYAGLLMKGDGIRKNEAKAFSLYQSLAKDGYAPAIFNLGLCYSRGDGVEPNQVTAFTYYQLASNRGMVRAMINYGLCYLNGKGVEQDHVKAFRIFEEAAEKGDVEAIYLTGFCYSNGFGVPKNESKAAQYFLKAADNNHILAAYNFALYNESRMALFRKNELTFKYFKIAADGRNPDAMFKLGCCYLYGTGCQKDETMAFSLFDLADKSGNVEALYYKAWCYYRGVGVERNKDMAKEAYKQASEKGYEKADGWLFLISLNVFDL